MGVNSAPFFSGTTGPIIPKFGICITQTLSWPYVRLHTDISGILRTFHRKTSRMWFRTTGSQNVCHGMPPILVAMLLKFCTIFVWTPLIDMKGALGECPEGSGIFTGIIFREDVSLDLLYQSFWNVAQLLFRPFWRASAMFRAKISVTSGIF